MGSGKNKPTCGAFSAALNCKDTIVHSCNLQTRTINANTLLASALNADTHAHTHTHTHTLSTAQRHNRDICSTRSDDQAPFLKNSALGARCQLLTSVDWALPVVLGELTGSPCMARFNGLSVNSAQILPLQARMRIGHDTACMYPGDQGSGVDARNTSCPGDSSALLLTGSAGSIEQATA